MQGLLSWPRWHERACASEATSTLHCSWVTSVWTWDYVQDHPCHQKHRCNHQPDMYIASAKAASQTAHTGRTSGCPSLQLLM
jgi:hypothetical protein